MLFHLPLICETFATVWTIVHIFSLFVAIFSVLFHFCLKVENFLTFWASVSCVADLVTVPAMLVPCTLKVERLVAAGADPFKSTCFLTIFLMTLFLPFGVKVFSTLRASERTLVTAMRAMVLPRTLGIKRPTTVKAYVFGTVLFMIFQLLF